MKDAARRGETKDAAGGEMKNAARGGNRQESAGHDEIVVMGRIQGPYGIKGLLKARAFTQAPEALLDYRSWWLEARDGTWHERKVVSARLHSDSIVVDVEGLADRETAAAWRGALIGVPRSALPELRRGEFYWADLVGFVVENRGGEQLGSVRGVLESSAHPVLQVEGGDGRERMIPMVSAYVDSIDAVGKRIVVDWGLDY
ncbi:MAG: ribosome maturation factor RimM [Betaproteobacteria bacterium]